MGRRIPIFNNTGGVSIADMKARERAFITFTSPQMSRVLVTTAPVTGVKITQQVDFNLTKTFGRDFLIATFGDQPVNIALEGLNIYNSDCNSLVTGQTNQIVAFYNANKVSTNLKQRVDVGIYGVGATKAFRCALVGLSVSADGGSASSGVYGYRLVMLGVPL